MQIRFSPRRFRLRRRAAALLAGGLVIISSAAWLQRDASAAPGVGGPDGPPTVIAWNDLGMHCIDPDFSVFSILPPFNTINAQVIFNSGLQDDGSGITLTYESVADANGSINTTSIGKTNFWSHVQDLFGVSPAPDVGLTGSGMPGPGNVPQPMDYDPAWAWFQGEGIPLTPLDDNLEKNPYPLMRITARNSAGQVLASTVTSVPNSQELECSRCHSSGGSPFARPAAGWAFDPDPLRDDRLNILQLHDERHLGEAVFDAALADAGYSSAGLLATSQTDGTAVLCSRCHVSNALPGTGLPGITPMTQAIHGLHGNVVNAQGDLLDDIPDRSSCYLCHPGFDTQCLRGAMGKAIGPDGEHAMDCQSCHGNQSDVGDPDRVGWLDQSTCQNCHTGTAIDNAGEIRFTSVFDAGGDPHVATNNIFATTPDVPEDGFSLYRFSSGHGGLQCSACHGPPHAIYPTDFANDNVQSELLQGHVGTVTDCATCHTNLEDNEIDGPHGMHPVDLKWVRDNHGDEAEQNGLNSCRACHGQDLRGTVLSQAQGQRVFPTTQFGVKSFWRGFQIGCYACHDGPNNEDPNNNVPPTVPNLSVATPSDVALELALSASDPDSSNLTFRIISQPANGTVAFSGSTATYRASDGFVGTDRFTYAAFDGESNSNLGRVDVNVELPDCAGSAQNYGFGCPGTDALLPTLSVSDGCPSPGSSFTLELEQALGGSVAFLAVGTGQSALELLPGCSLRVESLLFLSPGIPLTSGGPGQGTFSLNLTLGAGALPESFTLQAFVIDAGAPQGLAASNGVEVQFL